MTRKDYQLIAEVFGQQLRAMPESDRAPVQAVATALMFRFNKEDPAFQPARFLNAIESQLAKPER